MGSQPRWWYLVVHERNSTPATLWALSTASWLIPLWLLPSPILWNMHQRKWHYGMVALHSPWQTFAVLLSNNRWSTSRGFGSLFRCPSSEWKRVSSLWVRRQHHRALERWCPIPLTVAHVILGRTVLTALVFGTLFWPHFGAPRQWFYPRERGCCRDQGWRGHCDSCFSCSFGCCISCCLGPFFGCYLGCSSVPGQELDSCVVVWFSFLLLFWLALSLLSWFLFWSLLLCSWGPGTRIGSCMVVSVPLSYDFGCYFRWNIDDCQTILTFQHVISSLRVYASAILNTVRGRYVKDPHCLAAWLPAGVTAPLFLPCHPFEGSVPVNDRVWRSIVLRSKCVLQYFCWAWSWVGFGQSPFQYFCWVWLQPMTWENLRPKILARHDFSGYVGEASWDSFKSFIIPESPTGLAF